MGPVRTPAEPPDVTPPSAALAQLRRWEDFGGTWRVIAEDGDRLTISLRRCDGGEEAGRLVSREADVRAFVGH